MLQVFLCKNQDNNEPSNYSEKKDSSHTCENNSTVEDNAARHFSMMDLFPTGSGVTINCPEVSTDNAEHSEKHTELSHIEYFLAPRRKMPTLVYIEGNKKFCEVPLVKENSTFRTRSNKICEPDCVRKDYKRDGDDFRTTNPNCE